MLRGAEAEGPIVKGDQKWLEFTEGIADLGNGSEGRAILALTIPNRNGIKEMAEATGIGEQKNAGRLFFDPLAGKKGFRIGPGGAARNDLKMVVITEGIKPRFVVGKNRNRLGNRVQFIDIEGEEKDAVDELVAFGHEAKMPHGAFVETRIHIRI